MAVSYSSRATDLANTQKCFKDGLRFGRQVLQMLFQSNICGKSWKNKSEHLNDLLQIASCQNQQRLALFGCQ